VQGRFDVFRHAAAPRPLVWALLADHGAYSNWAGIPSSELEVEGTADRDGVGAIRRLGGGPLVVREQVVAFDPPSAMAYVILSGVPVQGYRADVELIATADGGTDIRWRGAFERAPRGLGGVVGIGLRRAVVQLADRLVRRSEALVGGSTSPT
jgi:hypothetical protein